MKKNKFKALLVMALMMVNFSVYSDVLIKPFISGSFSQILEQRKNNTFALIFWSIDCPSCYKELEMLSEFEKNTLDADIVLVSTDISITQNDLKLILNKYNIEHIELWQFKGDSDELLRFEIDRSWYGELPRSYIFKASEQKYVVSGVLSEEKLINFIKN